jgi:hypothetical protein
MSLNQDEAAKISEVMKALVEEGWELNDQVEGEAGKALNSSLNTLKGGKQTLGDDITSKESNMLSNSGSKMAKHDVEFEDAAEDSEVIQELTEAENKISDQNENDSGIFPDQMGSFSTLSDENLGSETPGEGASMMDMQGGGGLDDEITQFASENSSNLEVSFHENDAEAIFSDSNAPQLERHDSGSVPHRLDTDEQTKNQNASAPRENKAAQDRRREKPASLDDETRQGLADTVIASFSFDKDIQQAPSHRDDHAIMLSPRSVMADMSEKKMDDELNRNMKMHTVSDDICEDSSDTGKNIESQTTSERGSMEHNSSSDNNTHMSQAGQTQTQTQTQTKGKITQTQSKTAELTRKLRTLIPTMWHTGHRIEGNEVVFLIGVMLKDSDSDSDACWICEKRYADFSDLDEKLRLPPLPMLLEEMEQDGE